MSDSALLETIALLFPCTLLPPSSQQVVTLHECRIIVSWLCARNQNPPESHDELTEPDSALLKITATLSSPKRVPVVANSGHRHSFLGSGTPNQILTQNKREFKEVERQAKR